MKHALSSLLVATALVAPAAFAQTTATTKPVGYVTQKLKAGQFNLVGLTLHEPAVATGVLEAVSANAVTDNDVNFTNLPLTAGTTYILELTSGARSGLIQEITAWNGNTLTTPQDLSAASLGITAPVNYAIRKAKTLSDVFGAANSAGLKAGNANAADLVMVPNATGGFDSFYYSDGSGFVTVGWRKVGSGNTNFAGQALIFTDAIFIQRRGATDLDLVISGEVKVSPTVLAVSGQFEYVSSAFPVGATLGNSNLSSSFHPGTANSADIIMLPNGASGYDSYYYSDGSGFVTVGWRKVGGGNTDQANVPLTQAFIINRRQGSGFNATVSPPPGYQGL